MKKELYNPWLEPLGTNFIKVLKLTMDVTPGTLVH